MIFYLKFVVCILHHFHSTPPVHCGMTAILVVSLVSYVSKIDGTIDDWMISLPWYVSRHLEDLWLHRVRNMTTVMLMMMPFRPQFLVVKVLFGGGHDETSHIYSLNGGLVCCGIYVQDDVMGVLIVVPGDFQ
jgi:hypothetical protein